MMIFTNQALQERGIWPEYLITSGNEAGLSIADYIAFFADQPELKVIIIYVEAISQLAKFKAACRMARAAGQVDRRGQARPVGRRAQRRHGAYRLARGQRRGLRRDRGRGRRHPRRHPRRRGRDHRTARAYRRPARPPARRRHALRRLSRPAARFGGAQRAGIPRARTGDDRAAQCRAHGRIAGRQSDRRRLRRAQQRRQFHGQHRRAAGATRTWTWCWCRRDCRARPAPTAPSTTSASPTTTPPTKATKPIAFVTPISHGQTDYSRALRAKAPPRVVPAGGLQGACARSRASRAATSASACARARALAARERPRRSGATLIERLRARATAEPVALDEAQSKEVLRAYGIATPAEALVTSRAAAIEAAERIGYPVVLKAVSAELLHKSDVGRGGARSRQSPSNWRRPMTAWRSELQRHRLTGMLVCRQVRGGLELVLGLHRDPEMGLVVMAGSGGVLLELIKDVTFCAPPVSRGEGARHARPHARRQAACGLSRVARARCRRASSMRWSRSAGLAADLEDVVQSVDINPFVALPQGGLALDALIVLQRQAPRAPRPYPEPTRSRPLRGRRSTPSARDRAIGRTRGLC